MRGLFGVFVGSVWPHMSNFVLGTRCYFSSRPRFKWDSSLSQAFIRSYVEKLMPTAMGPLIQFMLRPL